jgi:ankyrin repeat protein
MLTLLMLLSAALPLAADADSSQPPDVEQFFAAIREGRSADVKRLLEANPSLATARNAKGVSAVTAALFRSHGEGFVPPQKNEVLAALLARGAPLDRFEAAALGGRARIVRELEADPAYLTSESSFGWAPLHFAAYGGNLKVAELLLDRGADINRRANTKFRNTPLQVSLLTAQEEMAAMLVKRGADVRIEQAEGFTALHEAAQIGSEKLAALLLDAGADPNARAEDGRTPLGIARKDGHEAVAKLLLARGAKERR